jgi:hypothetical protein
MNVSVSFEPLVPWLWLGLLLVPIAALALYGLVMRQRGAWLRVAAAAALALALANPVLLDEEREPLKSVVALVVDRSQSQDIGDRTDTTDRAVAELQARLARFGQFEVRTVEAGRADAADDRTQTRLFGALDGALRDVPPSRIAGAIMVTDGQVHDIPESTAGPTAPLHALVTGNEDERDRRIRFEKAPRFGIVNRELDMTYRVISAPQETGEVDVRVSINGEQRSIDRATIGEVMPLQITVPNAGRNIVELSIAPVDGELTETNNRAIALVDGIRENLRVLLVSGEPHAGERTWRNLLKSDASVDLVHFTILRPPEKQDGTPINELSLIAFPTRELFQQKISEFQLIIFDRYARQGVLPIIYFENIANYVRDGGAVMVAAGPDYASPTSIWRTPLDVILPAEPSGEVTEGGFIASLTDAGKRHPVTRALEGSASDPPHWSRWFRLVDTKRTTGINLMQGTGGKPLLVLGREGKGRVALLLSDHIWLWARGYEGGGPHLDLLRRVSHWLMKQPELEEEALRLIPRGRELTVQRQTMADTVGDVTLTAPSGAQRNLTLREAEPGLWSTTVSAGELGLWRATDGKLTALTNLGPANPREFAEVTSTADIVKAVASATGGDARRIENGDTVTLPRVVPVRTSSSFKGDDWIGLKMRDASVVRGIGVLPIFAGLLGLLLLIGSLALTWAREGR